MHCHIWYQSKAACTWASGCAGPLPVGYRFCGRSPKAYLAAGHQRMRYAFFWRFCPNRAVRSAHFCRKNGRQRLRDRFSCRICHPGVLRDHFSYRICHPGRLRDRFSCRSEQTERLRHLTSVEVSQPNGSASSLLQK